MVNGRVGSLALLVFLLIGFNANLIGAGLNESISEDVSEDLDLEELVLEEVVQETLKGDVNFTQIHDVSDAAIRVDENMALEEKNESENNTSKKVDNEEIFENETNALKDVNISEDVGFGYVDIDDLVKDIEVAPETEKEKEVVLKELVKNGRVELEFEIEEGDNIEIQKKEVSRSEVLKNVIVSSDEHFNDEVLVYSDLPSPAEKGDIIVTWENEGERVDVEDYFDLDDDGLIDRISWVVPHLSTQKYRIEIEIDSEENSNELSLGVDGPSGEVENPVSFEVSIDYVNSSDVECNLVIGVYSYPILDGDSFERDFDKGDYNWEVYCEDSNNILINADRTGSFSVVDSFDLEMDDFYLQREGVDGRVDANGGVVELRLVKPDNTEEWLDNLTGSFPQDFSFDSDKFDEAGEYSIRALSHYYEEISILEESFDVGSIDLSFDSSVDADEDVDFKIEVDSSQILTYDLYVGSSKVGGGYNSQTITDNFDEGSYDVELRNIQSNSKTFDDIDFGTLNVASGEDATDPDIELIFPDWEDEIDEDVIDFEFEVDEDDGIKNCSFKLYSATEDSSGVYETDDLLFPISSNDKKIANLDSDDVEDDEEVEIRLIDFDEGEYIWEVRCFDEAGNSDWDFNYFTVDFDGETTAKKDTEIATYDRQNEVEDLIDKMNSFLEKEDDYDLEERRVLEILGLGSDMSFWKKRLVQMDQDLKYNMKLMTAEKKAQRIEEIYDEIDEIKEKMILDIESVDSYEFKKGGVDLDLENIIENYMESTGVSISKSALKSLVRYNERIQGALDVSAETWKLRLEYLEGGNKEIVLVSKNINVNEDDFKILEVVDDSREIVFVTSVDSEGNGIYSVDVSDLEDGNLIYYFNEGFALKEVEDMETILFGEGSGGGAGITGMFIGVGDSLSFGSFFWLPLFLFLGYAGYMVFGKVRLENWKKEPGVEEIVRLINETNRIIREGKVEAARQNYVRMSEIYRALPRKCKDYFYRELKRIHLAIDKKDVLSLIKEYESAKDEFRRDDAMVIHGKINTIYKKLPKKFQEKVYARLVKKEV